MLPKLFIMNVNRSTSNIYIAYPWNVQKINFKITQKTLIFIDFAWIESFHQGIGSWSWRINAEKLFIHVVNNNNLLRLYKLIGLFTGYSIYFEDPLRFLRHVIFLCSLSSLRYILFLKFLLSEEKGGPSRSSFSSRSGRVTSTFLRDWASTTSCRNTTHPLTNRFKESAVVLYSNTIINVHGTNSHTWIL